MVPGCTEAVRVHLFKRRMTMKMIRALFLFLAVLLPTSWTIAHAEDAPAGDSGGDMKKSKKKSKKKDSGDMGDKKGDMDKK
jgi:hypothetical protein